MKTKSQVEKELKGSEEFSEIIYALETIPILPIITIKIIIAEAIMQYLTHAISFQMFLEIIDRIGERDEIKQDSPLNKIVTTLLSLSRFRSDPQTDKQLIILCINDVMNKLEKSRNKIKSLHYI